MAAADWASKLRATYHAAFTTAEREGLSTLAVPLLGAGARGAPVAEAMAVAAEAAISWQCMSAPILAAVAPGQTLSPRVAPVVRFGFQESSLAHAFIAALEHAMVSAATTGEEGSDSTFELAAPREQERWSL